MDGLHHLRGFQVSSSVQTTMNCGKVTSLVTAFSGPQYALTDVQSWSGTIAVLPVLWGGAVLPQRAVASRGLGPHCAPQASWQLVEKQL